jgi:acetyl esterase
MPRKLRAAWLDRDAHLFLAMFNLFARRRPLASYSIAQARQRWRWMAMALGGGDPGVKVSERMIDGPAGAIALRIFSPGRAGALRPALLWFPGGGFLVGDPDCADAMCRVMARSGNCIVIAVRFRLAPEHDLYAGRDDALAALRWVEREGAAIGVAGSLLAVGGDSAGGNIAAAVAQACARRRGPPLQLQLLVYPATNLRHEHPSKFENAKGYLLTAESIEWITAQIVGELDLCDPRLSPMRKPRLEGLPPALVLTAGFDPIRDDGLHYAARLCAAGVPVELLHYAGQFHGFLNFDALIGAASDALRRISQRLRDTLHEAKAADRTIEIGECAAPPGAAANTAANLGGAVLMTWESVDRWSFTLLRLASPTVASVAHGLWRPWLASVRRLRRGLAARIHRLDARLTYPTNGT